MQNNSLDDIVKCDIEIANPGSNDATFDSILLVVPAPETEGIAKLTKTTAISKADELLNYGYTVEDGITGGRVCGGAEINNPGGGGGRYRNHGAYTGV